MLPYHGRRAPWLPLPRLRCRRGLHRRFGEVSIPSEWNGLIQDGCIPFQKTPRRHDVDFDAEQLYEGTSKTNLVEQRCMTVHVDQQVEVRAGMCPSASDRAEDAHV